MSAISLTFGSLPTIPPLLHNATSRAPMYAVPVHVNLTVPRDATPSQRATIWATAPYSNWSISLNSSSPSPPSSGLYTGISINWPAADGPTNPPAPVSDTNTFWDFSAIAIPDLFNNYKGDCVKGYEGPGGPANGTCARVLGANCSLAIANELAFLRGDENIWGPCTSTEMGNITIPEVCVPILGGDNSTNITRKLYSYN